MTPRLFGSLGSLRLFGLAGVIGAALWVLGDILLVGTLARPSDYALIFGTYAHLVDTERAAQMVSAPKSRLAAGALVSNIGIVFYLAGTWHLFRGLLPAG